MGIYTWKTKLDKTASKVTRRHRRVRNFIAKALANRNLHPRVIKDKKKALKNDKRNEHIDLNNLIHDDIE